MNEPKSLYIALLDDLGIAGFAVILLITYGVGAHFRRAKDRLSSQLLAAWIALGVLGVFDTIVLSDRFAPNLLLGILVGLTLRPHESADEKTEPVVTGSQETKEPVLA